MLLVAGAAFAYVAAGRDQLSRAVRDARPALEAVQADGSTFSTLCDQLPGVEGVTGSGFDPAAYQRAAGEALGVLGQAGGLVKRDQARLAAADQALRRAEGWLTWPRRADLEYDRRQLASAQAGLADSARLIRLCRQQLISLESFVAAAGLYVQMERRLEAGDYPGTLALQARIQALVQAAGAAALGAPFTPVYRQVLSGLADIVDLTAAAASALQNRDYATANVKGDQLAAAASAFEKLDFAGAVDAKAMSGLSDAIDADFAAAGSLRGG